MKINVLNQPIILFGPGSEWLWAMLQFFMIAITLWLIYRQIKIQSSSHIISSLHILEEQWKQEAMLKSRLHICQKFLDDENDFDVHSQEVAAFFEKLGMYINTKTLPKQVVWDLYSWPIECYWQIFKDGIVNLQKEMKDPSLFKEFHDLAASMRKLNLSNKAPHFNPTSREVERFFSGEKKTLEFELNETIAEKKENK